MFHPHRWLLLLGGWCVVTGAMAGPWSGSPGEGEPRGARYPRPSEVEREVSGVRERTGGRVLSTQTYGEEGEEVEVIRVLTPDGRVRRFEFDHPRSRSGPLPR